MSRKLYVVYFGDDEPEFYEDRTDALDAAAQAVEDAPDNVEEIFVAEVIALTFKGEEGVDPAPGHEYDCGHGLFLLDETDEFATTNSKYVH